LSPKEVADTLSGHKNLPAGNLKKIGAEKLVKIFTGKEKDFVKYNFYKEIKELKKYCKSYGVSVEFRPFLARGLSYYNGSVFEVWSKELKVSLAGGGSYLVDKVQASGIAFGFEPINLLAKVDGDKTKVQIISVGQDKEAIELAGKLRGAGISTILLLDKSIGKALDYANSKGVAKVIFVGAEEVKKGKFKVKDMKTGKEEFLGEDKILKI